MRPPELGRGKSVIVRQLWGVDRVAKCDEVGLPHTANRKSLPAQAFEDVEGVVADWAYVTESGWFAPSQLVAHELPTVE
eukprot:CAMPEP_0206419668 /NCGR_PEP_ID=MMETSP0324_2-20121206/299_1 /ASSEMBLY_ACC=CAM_ASM_000836 /TAXON_ID=2866 /ORGANISM="Crypthecodinium cohnii, Strain Seligo" /LENGTH=78 /DNA_ID=CAMNT_0053883235 /DNA_START=657 /DNA_END=893 /DNA_ORIENTATION=-